MSDDGVALASPVEAKATPLTDAMRQEASARLAAARTKLILDKPFLGALVLRLPLAEAGAWCRTTGTDARKLYYNPQWIASLTTPEVQFALAHEALHCALGHFARRGHRVQRKWDLACDFAVNPLLMDEGLKPPLGAQVLDLYRGMAAEEIYPCIDDSLDNETFDEHVWDDDGEGGQGGAGGDKSEAQGRGGGGEPQPDHPGEADAGGDTAQGKVGAGDTANGAAADDIGVADDVPSTDSGPPPPLTAKERDNLQQQWQRHLAAAAQRAREAGKLSGSLARLAEEALASQVSWRAALAQYLSQASRDDYTWLRPSRRTGESGGGGGGSAGDAIFPSLRSHAGDIVVALDTSGSIADADLAQFVGELNAIKGTLPVRITLFACDATLAPDAPWVTESWQEFHLPRRFEGGGGTAFAPVFEWIERAGARPDALVYFTDAEGEFPGVAPNYPVLWLVKGKAPVPWGRRIQLN